MNTENQKKILEQMLRKRGINITTLCAKMDMTRPTLMRYLSEPMRMNGYMRKELSYNLGVGVDLIDDIVNAGVPYTQDWVEHIMYLIQPLPTYEETTAN
jgi:hypothetical protein